MEDIWKGLGEILSQPKKIDYTIQEVIEELDSYLWETIDWLSDFYIKEETIHWKPPKLMQFSGGIKKQVNEWFENWLIDLKKDFEKQKEKKFRDDHFENMGCVIAHINTHKLYRDIIIDFYGSFLKHYKKYELKYPNTREKSLYSAFNKLHQRLTNNPDSWIYEEYEDELDDNKGEMSEKNSKKQLTLFDQQFNIKKGEND